MVVLNSKTWKNIAKFALTVLLLGYVVRQAGPSRIAVSLTGVYIPLFLLTVIIGIGDVALSATKWYILLNALSVAPPWLEVFRIYYVGSFFSTVLPFQAGGDLVKAAEMTNNIKQNSHSYTSVFMDRLTGLVGFILIGLSGFVLLPRSLTKELLVPYSAILSGTILLILILYNSHFGVLLQRTISLFPDVLERKMNNFYLSVQAYSNEPRALLKSLGISLVFCFLSVLEVHLLSLSLGLEIPFTYLLAMVPIISVLLFLPISIQGYGVREVAFVVFLGAIDIPEHDAIALSFLLAIYMIVKNAIGGIGMVVDSTNLKI